MTDRRVTMRDVALAAGVSVQTVSNAINGRVDHMTSDTLARVERVMRDLAYHPSHAARGLRSARSSVLGFMILDDAARFLADPMTDLFLSGMGDVTRQMGYSLLIQAARPGDPIEDLLAPLQEAQADAAVVFLSGSRDMRQRSVEAFMGLGEKVIFLQEHLDAGMRNPPVVAADDRSATKELCRHLINAGHARIAFLTAAHQWSAIEERLAGYSDAMAEANLEPAPSHIVWSGDFNPLDASIAAEALLDTEPRPTAIICGNDLVALGAVKAARARGLRVPVDVAITGFDDFDFAAAVEPALTTVRIPGYEMGRFAAESLIGALADNSAVAGRVFPAELRLRESA